MKNRRNLVAVSRLLLSAGDVDADRAGRRRTAGDRRDTGAVESESQHARRQGDSGAKRSDRLSHWLVILFPGTLHHLHWYARNPDDQRQGRQRNLVVSREFPVESAPCRRK